METFLHLVDFGMVILLWLVQLVIYPSFLRVDPKQLVTWHSSYTFRVSFIIAPMLLAQFTLWILTAFQEPTAFSVFGCILVSICWILTFTVSVPLHDKISRGEGTRDTLQALVNTNWYRTLGWNALFVLGWFT